MPQIKLIIELCPSDARDISGYCSKLKMALIKSPSPASVPKLPYPNRFPQLAKKIPKIAILPTPYITMPTTCTFKLNSLEARKKKEMATRPVPTPCATPRPHRSAKNPDMGAEIVAPAYGPGK
ncbi:MAG: hypothetical protein SGARI_004588 [Bacillariaceae sp.]